MANAPIEPDWCEIEIPGDTAAEQFRVRCGFYLGADYWPALRALRSLRRSDDPRRWIAEAVRLYDAWRWFKVYDPAWAARIKADLSDDERLAHRRGMRAARQRLARRGGPPIGIPPRRVWPPPGRYRMANLRSPEPGAN